MLALGSTIGTIKTEGALGVNLLDKENVEAETQDNLIDIDDRNLAILNLVQTLLLDIRSGAGSPEDLSIKRDLLDEMLRRPEMEQTIQRQYQKLLEEIGEQIRMGGEPFVVVGPTRHFEE